MSTLQPKVDLRRSVVAVSLVAMAGMVGATVALAGSIPAIGLMAVPFLTLIVFWIYRTPSLGIYATILVSFFGAGMSRYVPGPTGLLVDGFLALTLVLVLLQKSGAIEWHRLKNGLFASAAIWSLYNVFELVNPLRPSAIAWFYAVRGVALYLLLTAGLSLLVLNNRKHLRQFIYVWLSLSVLGTLWGLRQLYVGLDGAELAWLSIPGNQTTHMLFGKLRVFSFFSDTGQFGAAQGHAAVVAGIMAIGKGHYRKRLLLGFVSLLSLYGLLISGTRGALAVPFVGFVVYLLLSKNWKILATGVILLVLVFGALKYTYVGHDVYEIRRMRTAVVQGTDNPSFQIRLENQKRLGQYLEGKPFGGGVGSAGYWGLRFSPDTFLANLALDSWYVKIWAEQGPVGLALYILILLYLMTIAWKRLSSVKDPKLRQTLLALYCGVAGILAASYGNQVLGQIPTGILVPISFHFLLSSDLFSKEIAKQASSDIRS